MLTLEAEAAEAGAVDDWDRLEPVAGRLHLLNTALPDALLAWLRGDENAQWFESVGRAHFAVAAKIAEDALGIIAVAQRRAA